MELTPIFRIEKFLDAIINNTTPPEPMFRVEYFLAKIGGADVVTPEPMFRIEKYLAKILGEDVEIPEPMFRTEFWLAKKCGEDVETPDPAFRVEYYLEEWCGGSAPTYQTITGKIVSFLTQRIAPLKIEATLAPIQSGTGDPSPENIRPISGHTGADVVRTGKNLFGGTKLRDGVLANVGGSTDDAENKYVSFTNASANNGSITAGFKFKPNTQYTFILTTSKNSTASTQNLRIYYTDNSYTNLTRNSETNTKERHSTVSDAGKTVSGLRKFNGGGTTKLYYDESGIFEGALTSADFEPYSGTTVTITFGQTVYGGNLVVNEDGSGTLTSEYDGAIAQADGTLKKLDGTSITGSGYKLGNYVLYDFDAAGSIVANSSICNMYKQANATALGVDQAQNIFNVTNSARLVFRDTNVSGWQEATSNPALYNAWKSYVAAQYALGNILFVIWKLTTPQTITISADVINALQGNNTVWVDDSSEIKVTFRSN